MAKFEVTVGYTWTEWYETEIIVEADDADRAGDLARELADTDSSYLDNVRKVGDGEAGATEITGIRRLPDDLDEPPAVCPTPTDNIERYSARLDELEISPNGDDFNNLLAMIRGCSYIEPHTRGR